MMTSAACLIGMAACQVANAVSYGFGNITANKLADAAIGEAQLSVNVEASGSQVLFTFLNSGPAASSITDVYFDDGALLGIASIINGPGVNFSQGAAPPNLPGGNAVNFNTTSGFLADSNPPAQPNGVNPGESLGILFNLEAGKTFDDVIAALALAGANPGVDVVGGLRIGIHVQGFTGGGSESFVNRVPDGGTTAGLMGLSMLLIGLFGRRRF